MRAQVIISISDVSGKLRDSASVEYYFTNALKPGSRYEPYLSWDWASADTGVRPFNFESDPYQFSSLVVINEIYGAR